MDKHRQRFGQIRIGNLLSIHEPEDDQDDEEHQFPMQPPLSFDAKEPLCQSKIKSADDGNDKDRVIDEKIDSALDPLSPFNLDRIG